MNCTEFSNLLDAWMDGGQTDDNAFAQLQAHAAACEECAWLLQLRLDGRRADEEAQVPASFSASWRQAIREEEKMEQKKSASTTWKKWIAVAAALVFVIGGTLMTRDQMPARTSSVARTPSSASYDGGGALYKTAASSDASYETVFEDDYAPMEAESAAEESAVTANGKAADNANAQAEKIIRTADFSIRTTSYDQDLQQLQSLTDQMGGRVEYMYASGDASSGQLRSANLTLRIPSGRLDAFLEGAGHIGKVVNMTQTQKDVSDSYYDTQTRLETQKQKLQRLQALMASAERVSDLIEIESAIADAQYYIDRYTSQLRTYDSKVDYSTVSVSVREIRITEAENVSWGQRLWRSVQDSLESGWEFVQDTIIFLVSALPWLVLIALVCLVVRVVVRRHKKKKEHKE